MKVIILSNGDIGDLDVLKRLIPPCDFVICADGGARHLDKLGLVPDLILGDFDSLSSDTLARYQQLGVPVKSYPRDKDRTDTHIAVDIAIEKKATHVYLLGALGNRWDHSYANLMLVYRLAINNVKGQIIDSHNTIFVFNDLLIIEGEPGQTVSLLPLGQNTRVAWTDGLKYPLKDAPLPLDFPIGVSNVMIASKAVIKVESGWIIAVKARD